MHGIPVYSYAFRNKSEPNFCQPSLLNRQIWRQNLSCVCVCVCVCGKCTAATELYNCHNAPDDCGRSVCLCVCVCVWQVFVSHRFLFSIFSNIYCSIDKSINRNPPSCVYIYTRTCTHKRTYTYTHTYIYIRGHCSMVIVFSAHRIICSIYIHTYTHRYTA